MSVGLDEVVAAVEARQAALVGEMAGYLVLGVADHVVSAPRAVSLAQLRLEASGDVRFVSAPAVGDDVAERGLRGLLALLLECSRSPTPGLARAARPRATAGVAGFVRELEAALVPVNRPASRRALSRLHRETLRALEAGVAVPDRPSLSAFAPPAPVVDPAPRLAPVEPPAAVERPSLDFVEVLDAELQIDVEGDDDSGAPTDCLPVHEVVLVPRSEDLAPRALESELPPRAVAPSLEDSTRPQPFVTKRRQSEGIREVTPLLGTVVDEPEGPWGGPAVASLVELTEPAPPVAWDDSDEPELEQAEDLVPSPFAAGLPEAATPAGAAPGPDAVDALDSGWSVEAPAVQSTELPEARAAAEPAPSRFAPRQSDVRDLARSFSVVEVDSSDLASGLRALAGVDAASASPPPANVRARSG